MIQLELTPIASIPTLTTFRTLRDPVRHLMVDYTPSLFSELAADGTPFNETHFVYVHGEYIGCLNRAFADTPWRIAPCGSVESKVHGFDFNSAVVALIELRRQEQGNDREWLRNLYSGKLR